jgi:hypothetical protein
MSSSFGGGPARFRRPADPDGGAWVDTVYLGAWRRATLEAHGGFDPGLGRNQDFELFQRIRDAGGRVWLDGRIRSRTAARDTVRDLATQYAGYGRAALALLAPLSQRSAAAVRVAAVGYAGAAAVAAWRGGARDARTWARTMLAFGIMHGAWAAGFWSGVMADGAAGPAGSGVRADDGG